MQKTTKKENKSGRTSLLRIIGMTILILLLIFAVGFLFSDTEADDDISTATDGKILYSVISDNVKDIKAYSSSDIAVLTDTSVKYFDSYGNSKASNEYTYSNPVMKTSGNNVLLFDRGAYSLRLEKNNSVYTELSFDSIITTAAIGKKCNYAYVLNANEGYQSHLYVFSYKGTKQFEWGYSSDYVTDIALSDNGNYACAAAMNADNAEYYSTVSLFKFNSAEPVYSIQLKGVAVYSVTFVGNKKVAVYSDAGVYLFDKKGEYKLIQEYTSTEMKFSAISSSGLGCTLINKFGNEKNALLTCFTENYKEIFTKEFNNAVKFIDCSDEYAAVGLTDSVCIYSADGTFCGTLSFDDTCIKGIISGRKLFVLFSDGIKCYSLSSAVL